MPSSCTTILCSVASPLSIMKSLLASVATVIMDICHKNLTMMARKFAKVMRVFVEIKHIDNWRVTLWPKRTRWLFPMLWSSHNLDHKFHSVCSMPLWALFCCQPVAVSELGSWWLLGMGGTLYEWEVQVEQWDSGLLHYDILLVWIYYITSSFDFVTGIQVRMETW